MYNFRFFSVPNYKFYPNILLYLFRTTTILNSTGVF